MNSSSIYENETIAIRAESISLGYILRNLSITTLKEGLIALLKGNFFTNRTYHMAIKKASIYAKRGECIALLGHNGSGKSTFLKVIAGILQPQQGNLIVSGNIAPLIELGAGFDPELTGRENVFLSCSLMGLTRQETKDRFETIVNFSELKDFLDQQVKTYSSGMYMRLAFSCASAVDAEIILIDEILAVGDQNFQKKCLNRIYEMRNSGSTIVLVSHDTNSVRQLADRVYVMENGEVIFEGTPDNAIEEYNISMHKRAMAIISEQHLSEFERKKMLLQNSNFSKHGEKVAIERVRLMNKDLSQSIKTNEPFKLSIDLVLKEPQENSVVVGFAIMRSQLRISGGNTKMFKRNLCEEGRYTVEFLFDSNPLSSGSYSIIAAVHDNRLIECFDFQLDALMFMVENEKDVNNFDADLICPYGLVREVSVEKIGALQ
jgi:ABC-type polysaccharide/polyol phosphate transport system ATPase subunit